MMVIAVDARNVDKRLCLLDYITAPGRDLPRSALWSPMPTGQQAIATDELMRAY